MRNLLLSLLVFVTFLVCSGPFAGACGDKLLGLGRGVKFGDLSSSYHASIIAFVPASLSQSAAVNDARFQEALRKAGVKLRLVQEVAGLEEAVPSGKYDIILVDLQDATMVETQVSNAGVNTIVMPVVYKGAELKSALATPYRCERKASDKNSTCFSTIEKAIELKHKRDEQQRRASN
jgi:hypothetical protein